MTPPIGRLQRMPDGGLCPVHRPRLLLPGLWQPPPADKGTPGITEGQRGDTPLSRPCSFVALTMCYEDKHDSMHHGQRSFKGTHRMAVGQIMPPSNAEILGTAKLCSEAVRTVCSFSSLRRSASAAASSLLLAAIRFGRRSEAVVLLLHALQERRAAARAAPPLEHACRCTC